MIYARPVSPARKPMYVVFAIPCAGASITAPRLIVKFCIEKPSNTPMSMRLSSHILARAPALKLYASVGYVRPCESVEPKSIVNCPSATRPNIEATPRDASEYGRSCMNRSSVYQKLRPTSAKPKRASSAAGLGPSALGAAVTGAVSRGCVVAGVSAGAAALVALALAGVVALEFVAAAVVAVVAAAPVVAVVAVAVVVLAGSGSA